MTKGAVSVLTIAGAVFLAAVTLQSQPWTVADGDDRPAAVRSDAQDVSQQQVERWLEVAEEIDPDWARQLRSVCDHDPDEFHRIMQRSGRSIVGLAELKSQNPDLYELKVSELRIEAQVEAAGAALVQAMRDGREEDIAAHEEDLRRIVLMQVVHSIKAQGDYLNRLKEHVEQLEAELEEEAANWQQTVEQRTQEIISRSQALAAKE